ncbi:MAG TPA: hypothetical protein VKA57_17040 [Solirubrobacteraceae bacterium]|nr:hypothetical protein [Solirubrobacteraceae bacterium]
MRDLHEELKALSVEWPATPDLTGAVMARLAARDETVVPREAAAASRQRPWSRRGWRPALAYALAALAAAFALTMAASPDARSAVLEWLGLKSVKVERREPSAPSPRPGTLGSGLGLGAPVTLEQARRRAPFLRLPEAAGLGRPDAIYVGGRSVSFVYGERPGYARSTTIGAAVLVQEFPGRVGAFIEKTLGQGAQLERLRVGADPAYFITGAHGFAYEGDEDVRFEDQRLAGNTLLVERADGLLIRVEGDLARDRAVAIAQSIP